MTARSSARVLLVALVLIHFAASQLTDITANGSQASSVPKADVVLFTIVTQVNDQSSPQVIFEQLAVPSYSRKHGFNYIALDGWTCKGEFGLPLKIWQDLNKYVNKTLAISSKESQALLKKLYETAGIKLLVNAFGNRQRPITQNLDVVQCSNKLQKFIKENNFDGVNIDFHDNQAFTRGDGINWLTQFSMKFPKKSRIISHSVDAILFNSLAYPKGDYCLVQKVVGREISFYNVRYYDARNAFDKYNNIFVEGKASLTSILDRGIPQNKIVVGKPSKEKDFGYVKPSILLEYLKMANKNAGWWGGVMLTPYIWQQARDQTRLLTLRRDYNEFISAVNLDTVNYWWPPDKTAADIGVPGYAPSNNYNYFIFGTWTCKLGAFQVSKLWSEATYYFSTIFGNTTANIQLNLKGKYQEKGKRILVRAFGNGQSPVSMNLDATTCAKSLASYIKLNNFDGTDINFEDNTAFNNGTAENWLISFTKTLRNLLPFHIISHTIQQNHLNKEKCPGGGYKKVMANVTSLIDFYQIEYFGQQKTKFSTYEELFTTSGSEFPGISVSQLVSNGFQLDKIVIYKPTKQLDILKIGFVEPLSLRNIFLKANKLLKWRTGVCYSSYLDDMNGKNLQLLLRGMNKADSIRFSYVDNINTWWPPTATLKEMGVPTHALFSIYNYFAYSFWTCGSGPLAMSKLYNDPITYLGTSLGKTKAEIQQYIKNLFRNANVKIMVSAFGASEHPVKAGLDPIKCANKFIDFINDNELDGVDIDFQDNQSFKEGTGEEWLIVFMKQLRKAIPFHIISHAPQGPYFTPSYAPNGGYNRINSQVGKMIDFYNIQFYNQMSAAYDTYDCLFIDSGTVFSNSSVYQIIRQGIPPEKVVVGKPASKEDVYNTGFVDKDVLKQLFKQAVLDKRNPGWKPSVMFWQYKSDLDGSAVATSMSYNS